MKSKEINQDDKILIKAYVGWCMKKGYFPPEYECSRIIKNTEEHHRDLVIEYLTKLKQNLDNISKITK